LRVRTLGAFISSLAILAIPATPASAVSTGGVAAGGSSAQGGSAAKGSKAPPVPLHAAPITARTPSIAYMGPVYEKTVTGEIVPYQPPAPAGVASGATGGSPVGTAATVKPQLLVPGATARYVDGLAAAPMSAPAAVQEIIWAGDEIVGLPYIFGGGHASFESPGYDCSGTVSFALHGANLLATPMDSSEFMVWGSKGVGRWVTVFSNAGHAYATVAGMRLDTSAADDPSNQQGPRWRPLRPANAGYVVDHPLGL
jgi:cell wall-associated NlpC family hydrolase